MNSGYRQLLRSAIMILAMTIICSLTAFASDDNSLADLGIKTQGASVSPEFKYDIWEYTVEVPEGTTELELEPHTTNPTATVESVSGTTLAEDGTGTVVITVSSESGNVIEYVLHVSQSRAAVDPAEAIAANESASSAPADTVVMQSEVETEDPRYVKVDRNSLEDAEKTIEKLQNTIREQREHIRMITYVLYALIATSIIFLFIVISQLLRRRDMAQELAIYRQGGFYKESSPAVFEDGWGDWGDEDADRGGKKRKKKKKKSEPEYDDWDDDPVNTQTSWTDARVGTPVPPQRSQGRSNGYPKQGRNPQGSYPNDQRMVSQETRVMRQPVQESGYTGQASQTRQSQETRVLGRRTSSTGGANAGRSARPVRQSETPPDVTKDLNRVSKAEAKAMRKAAAAEAKMEQDKRRAEQAREAEARRQAEEARKLAKAQEEARKAQEEALLAAAKESSTAKGGAQEAQGDEASGRNIKIDMVDL